MPGRKDTSDAILPVYVVHGPEEFLKRESATAIMDRVLAGADRALALSEYEGATAELAAVLDDLRTLPFLSDRRLVVVREADTFITRYRPELEEYFESPSPTGVLLMECRTFAASTRLAKRVAVVGQAVACEAVKPFSLPGWLSARSQRVHGKRLEPSAAALLREYTGADLGLLDSELQKLALYVGQRATITAAGVEAAVAHTREEQVWGILSAVAAGDEATAMASWEQVWETDRAAPARAIGGIAFKVRQLLNAKRAQLAGASMPELMKLLGAFRDERRVHKELGAFSVDEIEKMMIRLQAADVAAKSGGASVQSSMESFIVELCRSRSHRRGIA